MDKDGHKHSLLPSREQKKRFTTLHKVAKYGNAYQMSKVKYLTLRVNSKTGRNEVALHFTALKGDDVMASYLISKDADVNATDDTKQPPLHWAIIGNGGSVAKVLIQKGACLDAADEYGITALHWCAYYGLVDIAALLLKSGALVNIQDYKEKQTPLHIAVDMEHKKIIELLLGYGADIHMKNKNNTSPQDIAEYYGFSLLSIKGIRKEDLEREENFHAGQSLSPSQLADGPSCSHQLIRDDPKNPSSLVPSRSQRLKFGFGGRSQHYSPTVPQTGKSSAEPSPSRLSFGKSKPGQPSSSSFPTGESSYKLLQTAESPSSNRTPEWDAASSDSLSNLSSGSSTPLRPKKSPSIWSKISGKSSYDVSGPPEYSQSKGSSRKSSASSLPPKSAPQNEPSVSVSPESGPISPRTPTAVQVPNGGDSRQQEGPNHSAHRQNTVIQNIYIGTATFNNDNSLITNFNNSSNNNNNSSNNNINSMETNNNITTTTLTNNDNSTTTTNKNNKNTNTVESAQNVGINCNSMANTEVLRDDPDNNDN